MKLERRNEGTTDREHTNHPGPASRKQQRSDRPPSAGQELRLESRDADDDQFRGKSDGEMLDRYEF